MYAVIATGGKQYRVQEGAVVRIEKLDADQGASVEFNQVLLVGAGSSVTIGAPYVGIAKVTATVQSHGKGDKVRIVKFRRRKHYKRERNASAALYRCENHADRRLRFVRRDLNGT